MRIKILSIILCLVLLGSIVPSKSAFGLDYPTREIEFIAGYGPGSNTDNFARLAAKFGEKHMGKPIVVVNKPPAARGFVVRAAAKPDGFTIGIISNSTIGQQYPLKGVTFHYRKSYRVICQIDYSAGHIHRKRRTLQHSTEGIGQEGRGKTRRDQIRNWRFMDSSGFYEGSI